MGFPIEVSSQIPQPDVEMAQPEGSNYPKVRKRVWGLGLTGCRWFSCSRIVSEMGKLKESGGAQEKGKAGVPVWLPRQLQNIRVCLYLAFQHPPGWCWQPQAQPRSLSTIQAPRQPRNQHQHGHQVPDPK